VGPIFTGIFVGATYSGMTSEILRLEGAHCSLDNTSRHFVQGPGVSRFVQVLAQANEFLQTCGNSLEGVNWNVEDV
jgi:hypothetical protein